LLILLQYKPEIAGEKEIENFNRHEASLTGQKEQFTFFSLSPLQV